jgi:hypothetical protein
VRPERRGQLPGAEQDERRERHGKRAAEAFERTGGERCAQDQRQRKDDRREAGRAREEAAGVEGQVDDRRRGEQHQGHQPNQLQRLTLGRRDSGSFTRRRADPHRFARHCAQVAPASPRSPRRRDARQRDAR